MSATSIALLCATGLFAAFVVLQAVRGALGRAGRLSRTAFSESVARGSDPKLPPAERGTALRDASRAALDAGRPRLAARYALWAEREDPGNVETLRVVVSAMSRAGRHRALETYLWKALDAHASGSLREEAQTSLLALYEGPMKLPERARVLRALGARKDAT